MMLVQAFVVALTCGAAPTAGRSPAQRFEALVDATIAAQRAGDPVKVVRLADRGLALLRAGKVRASALGYPIPLAAAYMHHLAGVALLSSRRFAAAIGRLDAAINAYEDSASTDFFGLVHARNSLARALWAVGERARAEELSRELADAYLRIPDSEDACEGAIHLVALASLAKDNGDVGTAEHHLDDALRLCRRTPEASDAMLATEWLIDLALAQGDARKAAPLAENLVLVLEARGAPGEARARALARLGDALAALGHNAAAEKAKRGAARVGLDAPPVVEKSPPRKAQPRRFPRRMGWAMV